MQEFARQTRDVFAEVVALLPPEHQQRILAKMSTQASPSADGSLPSAKPKQLVRIDDPKRIIISEDESSDRISDTENL